MRVQKASFTATTGLSGSRGLLITDAIGLRRIASTSADASGSSPPMWGSSSLLSDASVKVASPQHTSVSTGRRSPRRACERMC